MADIVRLLLISACLLVAFWSAGRAAGALVSGRLAGKAYGEAVVYRREPGRFLGTLAIHVAIMSIALVAMLKVAREVF